MSLEQEIKLAVTQPQALQLDKLAWLTALLAAPARRQRLSSTYFDTAGKTLMRHGVGLRLRQVDQHWLQTVKCTGEAVDGLHQRQEWEHELPGPAFDPDLLRQTALAALVDDDQVWPNIAPVFTTEFERLLMLLKLEDGSEVELAYDRGQVIAGEHQSVIHEIELELKHGSLEKVQQLARRLMDELPLQRSDISKAAQGYALAQAAEK